MSSTWYNQKWCEQKLITCLIAWNNNLKIQLTACCQTGQTTLLRGEMTLTLEFIRTRDMHIQIKVKKSSQHVSRHRHCCFLTIRYSSCCFSYMQSWSGASQVKPFRIELKSLIRSNWWIYHLTFSIESLTADSHKMTAVPLYWCYVVSIHTVSQKAFVKIRRSVVNMLF